VYQLTCVCTDNMRADDLILASAAYDFRESFGLFFGLSAVVIGKVSAIDMYICFTKLLFRFVFS